MNESIEQLQLFSQELILAALRTIRKPPLVEQVLYRDCEKPVITQRNKFKIPHNGISTHVLRFGVRYSFAPCGLCACPCSFSKVLEHSTGQFVHGSNFPLPLKSKHGL